MNGEFLNIIEQYKTNKDLIDKIRIYILNHLYMTDDITQYVTLFSDIAKSCGYTKDKTLRLLKLLQSK